MFHFSLNYLLLWNPYLLHLKRFPGSSIIQFFSFLSDSGIVSRRARRLKHSLPVLCGSDGLGVRLLSLPKCLIGLACVWPHIHGGCCSWELQTVFECSGIFSLHTCTSLHLNFEALGTRTIGLESSWGAWVIIVPLATAFSERRYREQKTFINITNNRIVWEKRSAVHIIDGKLWAGRKSVRTIK